MVDYNVLLREISLSLISFKYRIEQCHYSIYIYVILAKSVK